LYPIKVKELARSFEIRIAQIGLQFYILAIRCLRCRLIAGKRGDAAPLMFKNPIFF